MLQRDVIAAVRALGLVAVYDRDMAEWRIDYRRGDTRYVAGDEGSAYFTNDRDDAVLTARTMAESKGCAS